MRYLSRLCLSFLILLPGCGSDTGSAPVITLPTVPATIVTASGEKTLTLEVASSSAQQEQGLAGRKALAAGTGMLFPFDPPRIPSFWMRGTHIALDLIFIRTDGTIAAILPGKPEDETPIATGQPARAVIEIGGGEAARLGIAPGDRVRWGKCPSQAETQGAGSSANDNNADLAESFCL